MTKFRPSRPGPPLRDNSRCLPGRRSVIAAALAVPFVPRSGVGQATSRVVVVGGGFGGGRVARAPRRVGPLVYVALVEANPIFTACPFSNEVIAGLRDIAEQRFGYQAIAASGVHVIEATAVAVDPASRRV